MIAGVTNTCAVVLGLFALFLSASAARAQELVPGAYTPAPTGFNVVTVAASVSRGDLAFDPSLPVEDGYARLGHMVLALGRTLNCAGRFSNLVISLPLVNGDLEGLVGGQFQQASRTGQGDLAVRFGINLYGAPALTLPEFAKYRAKSLVAVSVAVVAPVGQYDPSRYVNIGTNRWALKVETGLLRAWRRWTLEGDFGVAFYTDNTNYLNGGTLDQAPVAAAQGHLIYTVRPGMWVAGDVNYWRGGRITVNGASNLEQQRNSRAGVTVAVPIARQQIRIAYSFGAYTNIGGDFKTIGVSYSYAWTGRP